ncbi:IPT/TIG domain-containing protein, partial [Nocardia abscessus]|uniref:IPT/TIG domain-containing protein n=1 Tax=Nocardia abscessus TaxID=120957 RepID=UPI003CC7E46A
TTAAPTEGAEAGGTTVVITGTDLTGATSVKIGGHPAPQVTRGNPPPFLFF